MTLVAPTPVLVLWWIALALTVLVIVPVVLRLLHRAWRAATEIRVYTAETLDAARGIAEHTGRIGALDATIEGAGPVLEKSAAIRDAVAELERVLRRRVA